jgi:1-phosphatidylinositol-4-phosphate 5-kinase
LTNYYSLKKFEHFVKLVAFGPTISAIPPKEYAQRFISFIEKMIETD